MAGPRKMDTNEALNQLVKATLGSVPNNVRKIKYKDPEKNEKLRELLETNGHTELAAAIPAYEAGGDAWCGFKVNVVDVMKKKYNDEKGASSGLAARLGCTTLGLALIAPAPAPLLTMAPAPILAPALAEALWH